MTMAAEHAPTSAPVVIASAEPLHENSGWLMTKLLERAFERVQSPDPVAAAEACRRRLASELNCYNVNSLFAALSKSAPADRSTPCT